MTISDNEERRQWEQQELPKILSGECWQPATKAKIDALFGEYTGLEGLRGAFYLGAESYDCMGMIPNEYASDDPKHKAFDAGFVAGEKVWGSWR